FDEPGQLRLQRSSYPQRCRQHRIGRLAQPFDQRVHRGGGVRPVVLNPAAGCAGQLHHQDLIGGGGMTTTYKGWYLLDHHKNRTRPEGGVAGDPRTKPWYASRRTCQHGYNRPHLIVIHTPETIEDFTPPYDEAERVAKYGAQTTLASWHDTIDADSIIPMLPPTYTAWHVRGFNRCAIGMEIGAKATSWKRAPAAWVKGVVENAAYRAAQHAATFDIPARLLFTPGKRYSSAINPTGVGFVSHHALDPGRR